MITVDFSRVYTAAIIVLLFASGVMVFIRPRVPVFLYTFLILVFEFSKYGMEVANNTIYDRGEKLSPIPLIVIFLCLLFVYFGIRRILNRRGSSYFPIRMPLFGLLSLFLLYLMLGFGSGIGLMKILNQNLGISNLVYMSLYSFIISWSLLKSDDIESFKRVFLIAAGTAGLFFVVRYSFYGGDPANIYSSLSNVKLTSFDISSGGVFAICLTYSSLRILRDHEQKAGGRVMAVILILLSLFNIVFSYRRTAWGGLILIFIWVVKNVNLSKKVALIAVILPLALGSLPFMIANRYSGMPEAKGNADTLLTDITDKKGEVQFKRGRFGELYSAYLTWKKNPLLGAGPWGTHGSEKLLGNHAYFVHSSIFHMLFKTGLVGTFIYVTLLVSFVISWIRVRKEKWSNQDYRTLGDGFFGGFLFLIPDLIFGTPIIIFRNMQLLALIFSIPFVLYNVDKQKRFQELPLCNLRGINKYD